MKINIKTAVINVITTLILAMILEGFLFLGLRYPSYLPGFTERIFQEIYMEADRNVVQYECGQYDPGLFYRMKPGECIFDNIEFSVLNKINSKGLRDDEQSLNSPEIIALGDSYTMGWGVNQDESYPQILEKEGKFNVLNAGISSYGTAREMLLLQQLDTTGMKSLIIQYSPNDYPENVEYLKNNYRLPIRDAGLFDVVREEADNNKQYYPFKYTFTFAKTIARHLKQRVAPKAPVSPSEAEAFLEILNYHVKQWRDIDILVFTIDDYYSHNDKFADELDALLKTEKFSDLPVTTVRVGDIIQKDDYFTLDDHLVTSGHQKLSTRLQKTIQALGK